MGQLKMGRGVRSWRLMVLGPVVVVLTVAGLLVAPASGAAKRPFCGQAWGSLPKQVGNFEGAPSSVLTNVRAGRDACFDRLILDLSGSPVGYRVEYVRQVTEDGSGAPIPLRGGAFLSIVAAAPAHDDAYRPTYRPADRSNIVNVAGFTTFRQVAFGGTFEGLTTIGLGVRATLPFRVFVLAGPGSGSRLVVDVSHRWV